MFTLSAFADEISPDPEEQLAVLKQCGLRHLELRSILRTNVLDLSAMQVAELQSLLKREGVRLSALGSPIGKVPIDQDFAPHWERFRHALELCKIFETNNMRIFSYYLPEGQTPGDDSWQRWRPEVLRRLEEQVRLAEKAGVRLLHENEHRIYGDSPERVSDLFRTLLSGGDNPYFRAVYDAANYVFCGYDPWEGWVQTRAWTAHFHIKDWVAGERHGRLAGEGQGRLRDVLRDATARRLSGFLTLEPHLLGGGPTGGVTGPELFPQAVAALRRLLDEVGASYQ